MSSRYLITTADQRTWRHDRPVLFLGEWCCYYDAKHVWGGMDAVVAEPYGVCSDQKERNNFYLQELFQQLLKVVAEALNEFHEVGHSLRYWHILIGHWLHRYLTVTFNRYFTLEQALDRHAVSGTAVLYPESYSLVTVDSLSFIWACNDDVWNHVLYSRILRFWKYSNVDLVIDGLQGQSCFSILGSPTAAGRASIASRCIRYVANNILPRFSSKRDAFIINSYLPLKEEIKLQLNFGQCPQLWLSPTLKAVAANPKDRQCFRIDAENYQGFERFVRLQISEIIPTCYLEGYGRLCQQAETLPWPTKPRFIFTANNFDTDEIFKAWTGSKVELGIPYFTGQHGNYCVSPYMEADNNSPECVTADKFFTWGWSDDDPNNVPAFNFKIASSKLGGFNPKGGLLLIELHVPHLLTHWDSYFEFGIYQQEQFCFVEALPETIQKRLKVRLHSACLRLRWSDEHRWKDFGARVQIETGLASVSELIAESRLVVHSYDSTGILETLALNIPTVCFWHGGLDHLLPSAKPYYELLRNAKILADTPEQAAEFITLHWYSINEWWGSQKVQYARKTFCDKYSRTEKNPTRTMHRLLSAHVN